MNPQVYTDLLAMEQQRGKPVTSPGPIHQRVAPAVPRFDSSNPLGEGSMAAVNAARQSLGGRKSGMLNGIMELAQNLAVANLRGSDRPAENAMGQILRTPEEERAMQEAQNFKMLQFLQANEQIKQQNAHRAAVLAEQRRMHNMLHARHLSKSGHNSHQIAEEIQKIYPGAVPYMGRTAQERSAMTKEMMQRANKPNQDIKTMETLDEMADIVRNNPHLSTSAAALLFPKNYEGGVIDTLRLKLMDIFTRKKDRANLERLEKLKNDLTLDKVHGLSGQRANMFLEKVMKKSNPNQGMTAEAMDAVRRHHMEHELLPGIPDSKKVKKALMGIPKYGASGYFYVPKEDVEYSDPFPNGLENSGSKDESNLDDFEKIKNLSDEDLMLLAR